MMIRASVSFLLVIFFLPFGLGNAVLPRQSRLLQFVCGFAVSLSLFEVLALIFHATGASLRLMVLLWSILCAAGALFGWKISRISVAFVDRTSRREKADGWEKALFIIALLAVAVITLNTVFNTTYVNWDDQTYCTNAVDSWQSDLVNRLAPHSGTMRPAFYDKKYAIAAWPVYSSMLAVLSGIHPAIIFRTLLPLFEVPAAFGIVYLLLREIFPKNRKKALLGLIYYIFFALAVAEKMGANCSEWWVFINCWTGKAIAFNIVVPLVLWLLLQLEKEQGTQGKNACWITLFFVCCGACNIAATLFMVLPIEIGAWGIFSLYRTRKWNEIWKFALCAAPSLACALATM